MIAKVLIGGMGLCVPLDGTLAGKEAGTSAPEWGVSLRDAIQAAIENNVNVRLLKEQIAAA